MREGHNEQKTGMRMTALLGILGALGGVVVFAGAIITIIKGIFRQVHATEENTKALNALSNTVTGLDSRLDDHAQRIARLEGKVK